MFYKITYGIAAYINEAMYANISDIDVHESNFLGKPTQCNALTFITSIVISYNLFQYCKSYKY